MKVLVVIEMSLDWHEDLSGYGNVLLPKLQLSESKHGLIQLV